jgi:hypothetical protein
MSTGTEHRVILQWAAPNGPRVALRWRRTGALSC